MKHYLDEQITGRLNLKKIDLEILRSAYARFTLNESGKVIDAAIIRTSNSPVVDSLFIKALKTMPRWHVPTGHGVTFPIKLNAPYTVLYR